MSSSTLTATNAMAVTDLNQIQEEIQCGDVSQSRQSPAIRAHPMQPKPQTVPVAQHTPPMMYQAAVMNGAK